MEKEKIVKEAFVEVSKKYQHLFNSSIDTTFNNLINEVWLKLFFDNDNKYDNEISYIHQSICNILRVEISTYVISRFTDKNIEKMIQNIDTNNKIQFDKRFIEDIKWKEENSFWIHPIEKRLKEYIENK